MTHGSNYAYIKRKCRCPECKAWAAAWQKEYRKRRCAKTGEVFSGNRGGFVPGKPCLCGCGERIAAASPNGYRRGHKVRIGKKTEIGMFLVVRCTEPPAVPSDIVICSHCGEKCWASKKTGKRGMALAATLGDSSIICVVCFDVIFGSGTQ